MVEEPLVVSISSGTSLNPDEIARRTFPSARKGVDGDAVRRYLESVADELRAVLEREGQLRRRALEAERKAAEPPVLDEATLSRAVGAETARILQTAHDAGRDVVARAETRAGEVVAEAEAQAAERGATAHEEASAALEAATEEAAALVQTALAEATALQESAQAEAEALTTAAQEDAVALLSTTRQRCREAVREAKQLRRSVLEDLVERRRALFVQLEQLRSGRDSLVEVVDVVGGAVNELRDRLERAEHDARVAAAEAGDKAELLAEDEVDTLLEPEIALDLRKGLLGDDLDTEPEGEPSAVLEAAFGTEPGDEIEHGIEALDRLGDDAEITEQDDIAASHRSVGELFARIRASRGSEESQAVSEESQAVAEDALPDAPGIEDIDDVPDIEDAPDVGEAEDPGGDAVEGGVAAATAEAVEDAADGGAESLTQTSDAAVISRRDALLKPVETKLSRSLKRALQDDQNELMNAIRHASGTPDLDTLLPEEVQRERYERAVSPALADGWRVGRSWLRGERSETDDDVAVGALAAETGRALGTELAGELAGLLRHRLSESLRALGDVGDGAQDAAGAAYREWKGDRVEGFAGDFATRAFAGGAVAAAEGTVVRWVVDDGRPCPDCDDNALADAQPAGGEWPTGQLHPPVHPGCRCLLVAITD
jgi:hypothetical protein